jgi:hypothetical protein
MTNCKMTLLLPLTTKESLDDRLFRYESKVRVDWRHICGCGSLLVTLMFVLPASWYGLYYWLWKKESWSNMSGAKQTGVILVASLLAGLTLFPIIRCVICLVKGSNICILLAILRLCIYQIWSRKRSQDRFTLWVIRPPRDWHNIDSCKAKSTLCTECRRIVETSTLINGSTLGVVYSIEKYRHHSLAALARFAQQCHLCHRFLRSVQEHWKLEPETLEQTSSKLQVEIRAVKTAGGGTSLWLRLYCTNLPRYLAMRIDEIHKSKSE